MNDVAKWKVRGSVKTLQTEFAVWDLNLESWQPAQHLTLTSFRPAGTVSASDTHNPDGSIAHSRWLYDEAERLTETRFCLNDGLVDTTVCFYDEAGRHQRTVQLNTQTDLVISSYDARGVRTQTRSLGPRGVNIAYGIEGTEQAYGAPGAATMIVTDDESVRPAKVIFQDANGRSLREVIFARDHTGRLLSEEMRVGEEFPEPLRKAFGEIFSRITYSYDSRGRRLERMNKFGGIGETRTTYRYDDSDDPIEEVTEDTNREMSIDDNGAINYSSDRVSVQHNRFEYRYDAHGNWTERIVSIRLEPNPGFQRSNIERRVITYY